METYWVSPAQPAGMDKDLQEELKNSVCAALSALMRNEAKGRNQSQSLEEDTVSS